MLTLVKKRLENVDEEMDHVVGLYEAEAVVNVALPGADEVQGLREGDLVVPREDGGGILGSVCRVVARVVEVADQVGDAGLVLLAHAGVDEVVDREQVGDCLRVRVHELLTTIPAEYQL